MNEELRLALVGCGRQMQQNLLPFLQRVRGHEIVVCVDPNSTRAQEVRSLSGAAGCTDTVEALDLSAVDAAVLAVPPEPSSRLTSFLVSHGIDCFVEKPAGPSTQALARLRDVVRRSGRHVQVGFNFRYAEALRRLHELTKDARSAPCVVTIDFFSRHPAAPQWGVNSTMEAWIRHNSVHAFDLARWFVPAALAKLDAYVLPCGENRFMMNIVMRHEDGSLTTLRVGNHTKSFMIGASVQGVDGSRFTVSSLEQVTLDLDAGTPSGAVLYSTRNLDNGWARSGFGPELADFVGVSRKVAQPAPFQPTVADALAASVLCDWTLDQLIVGSGSYGPVNGADRKREFQGVAAKIQ